MTYTIHIAGSLMDDLLPVIESNEDCVNDQALAEWCSAYRDAKPRGNNWVLTLSTRDGLIEAREDIVYRLNHHAPTSISGTYYPQVAVRRAAARALGAIDEMLGVE